MYRNVPTIKVVSLSPDIIIMGENGERGVNEKARSDDRGRREQSHRIGLGGGGGGPERI